jgi:hypothetical protein
VGPFVAMVLSFAAVRPGAVSQKHRHQTYFWTTSFT